MNKPFSSYADPLDIWGIITDHIDFDESNPVEEVFLKLNFVEEGSYVDVHYYNETEPERTLAEDPKTATFYLTSEIVEKMYRDLMDSMNLPSDPLSLEVRMDHHKGVRFHMKGYQAVTDIKIKGILQET